MSKSRIFVTGAGGFLGSHMARRFLDRKYPVAAVGRFDMAEILPLPFTLFAGMTLPDPAFARAVRRFRPDVMIHCAGTASVPDSVAEPYQDFRDTVDVCAFALETIRREAPGCRFILLSSAAVYGEPQKLPVPEAAPCAPISPYAFHKRLCEMLVEEYAALHGVPSLTLRIFSAYGERLRRQILCDLCRKFSDPARKEVEVIGTGDETRDFVHAADVAAAAEALLEANAAGVYNVASGTETAVREIVETVRAALAPEKGIRYSGSTRRGDPLRWRADIGKLCAAGFAPSVALADGVARYCRWFAEQS